MSNIARLPANDAAAVAELYESSAALYARSRSDLIQAVRIRLECGRILAQKKQELGHNHWLPWLNHNAEVLGFGPLTAQRLIKAYRSNTSLGDGFDEADALALSRRMWGHDKPKALPAPVAVRAESESENETSAHASTVEDGDDDVAEITPDNHRTAFLMRCDDSQVLAKHNAEIFNDLRASVTRLRGGAELLKAVEATAAQWLNLAEHIRAQLK